MCCRRIEQVSLDLLDEDQPKHGRGHECDNQIECELARRGFGFHAGSDMHEPVAVDPDHGQDGGELDGDLEYLAFLAVEVQQLAGQDQVACGGDGQEFGESFHQAEQSGLEQQDGVHVSRMIGLW